MALPETSVCSPWTLVRHAGELRLAYVTKYFGQGFPVGTLNGGRGHLVLDSGMFTEESDEPVVFKSSDLVYEWRNRPSYQQLQAARSKEGISA